MSCFSEKTGVSRSLREWKMWPALLCWGWVLLVEEPAGQRLGGHQKFPEARVDEKETGRRDVAKWGNLLPPTCYNLGLRPIWPCPPGKTGRGHYQASQGKLGLPLWCTCLCPMITRPQLLGHVVVGWLVRVGWKAQSSSRVWFSIDDVSLVRCPDLEAVPQCIRRSLAYTQPDTEFSESIRLFRNICIT